MALVEPAHLDPRACQALSLPVEERIDYLRHPRWIGYSRARQIGGYCKFPSLLRLTFL
jgi:hypothetical protein